MLLSVSIIYGLCLTVICYRVSCARKSTPGVGACIKGRVVDVISGDAFIMVRHGRYFIVNIAGLRKPPSDSPWQPVASWALVGKVLGRRVSVEIEDVDAIGSIVGRVNCDKRDLRLDMIQEGHGRARRVSPIDFSLLLAEREARRKGLGLWHAREVKDPVSDQKSLGYKGR